MGAIENIIAALMGQEPVPDKRTKSLSLVVERPPPEGFNIWPSPERRAQLDDRTNRLNRGLFWNTAGVYDKPPDSSNWREMARSREVDTPDAAWHGFPVAPGDQASIDEHVNADYGQNQILGKAEKDEQRRRLERGYSQNAYEVWKSQMTNPKAYLQDLDQKRKDSQISDIMSALSNLTE